MAVINETNVQAHTARERDGKPVDAFLWDDELIGFCCKATPAGKRAFFVQYRPRGSGQNIRRVHIGYHGKLTAAQARAQAKRLLGEANAGNDPRAQQKEAKKAELAEKAALARKKADGTLQKAIEDYLAANEKPKDNPSDYWLEKRSRLLRYTDGLLARPIGDLSKAEIKRAISSVEAKSQATAQLLYGDLRRVLNFALEHERITAHPMEGLRGPKPVAARDRVLEPHEVAAFWQAASETSWPFGEIYRLLLLTGQRREEVAGVRWSELDFDASMWTLPGTRTKNKREHRVPLPSAALAILDRDAIDKAKAENGYPLKSDLVFSTTGTTPPSGFSKAKRQLDLRMAELLGSKWDEKAEAFVGGRFKPWRVHDLRRTCATGMEDLGIPMHIVEAALNHVSGAKAGIVGTYQRSKHREAVRHAFEAWDARVAELTGQDMPSNVIAFRSA